MCLWFVLWFACTMYQYNVLYLWYIGIGKLHKNKVIIANYRYIMHSVEIFLSRQLIRWPLPVTHSVCILNSAILRVLSTSCAGICFCRDSKWGGSYIDQNAVGAILLLVPLLAIIISQAYKFRLLCSEIHSPLSQKECNPLAPSNFCTVSLWWKHSLALRVSLQYTSKCTV